MSTIADNSADRGSQDRPDYLLEKFGSAEDQAKAYAESEKLATQATQRASEAERRAQQLEGQLQELSAQQDMLYQSIQQGQQQQPQQYDPSADPLVLAYEQAVENGDARAQLGIHAVVAQQAAEAQLRQFAAQQQQASQPDPGQEMAQSRMFAMLADQEAGKRIGEEWDDLRADVGQLIAENPHLIPNTPDPVIAAQALAMAANMVKANRLVERADTLGNQTDQLNRSMKLQAQTMTGRNGPVQTLDDKAAFAERLRNVPPTYGSGS